MNAIVYMVDAADHEKIEASKNELHNLLEKPQLAGIPILVLGNKRDLEGALDENGLIERLNLRAVQDREICCYSVSCKEKDNIDITLQWLISHSKSGGTAAAATSSPSPGIHTSSSATSTVYKLPLKKVKFTRYNRNGHQMFLTNSNFEANQNHSSQSMKPILKVSVSI